MRRATYRNEDQTVDYAAVGATQAQDLMQYPPEKSTPAEESWKLGSGEDRFRTASDALLAWTAQKAAGLTLSDIRQASGPVYQGVSFDDEGNPIMPSRNDAEPRYAEDGTPFASAGMTVHVHGRVGGHRADAKLRVIFVIEDKRRVGFALGTVGESSVSGEESFMVEWAKDGEVWFTVRAFDAPNALLYKLLPGLMRRRRKALFTQYLRAISPMYAS